MLSVMSFRIYTKKCRPVWTLTWRECASPSIHSGVPEVREIDTDFNKDIAKKYIKKYGVKNIKDITDYLSSKSENYIKYVAKSSCGYSHKILTSEWQSMSYFLAILNVVVRNNDTLLNS
jgi:hypothetical protein